MSTPTRPHRGAGPARGQSWIRLAVAAAVGGSTVAATAVATSAGVAGPLGWLAAAAVYLGWTWAAISPMDPRETAAHATREDPSQAASDLLVLTASVAALAAVGALVANAHSGHRAVSAAIAVCSVAASWLVAHTVFTLRYARLYYGGPVGGIDFNQDAPPSYADFAYLAFTIGMTYQVSDTALSASDIRATALRHGLLSFLNGAVVLATTVNLVASLSTAAP
jgi:uncharacterized membrane protein